MSSRSGTSVTSTFCAPAGTAKANSAAAAPLPQSETSTVYCGQPVTSFVVIGLHTLYLYGLLSENLSPLQLMVVTLAAYLTYVVNAGQFLLKLRRARLDTPAAASDLDRRLAA